MAVPVRLEKSGTVSGFGRRRDDEELTVRLGRPTTAATAATASRAWPPQKARTASTASTATAAAIRAGPARSRVAAAVQLRYTHRNIAVGTLTKATMSASRSADS